MADRRSTPRSTNRPKNAITRVTTRRRPEQAAPSKDWERRLVALGDPANPWHPMRDE